MEWRAPTTAHLDALFGWVCLHALAGIAYIRNKYRKVSIAFTRRRAIIVDACQHPPRITSTIAFAHFDAFVATKALPRTEECHPHKPFSESDETV